ncbi:MAG: hypothetical protein U1F42_02195 [Candidatus Competibacteraceae bacterium]
MTDKEREILLNDPVAADPDLRGRRDFLVSLGKWSKAVVGGVLLGGVLVPEHDAKAWGWGNGGGRSWVNGWGGGWGGGWGWGFGGGAGAIGRGAGATGRGAGAIGLVGTTVGVGIMAAVGITAVPVGGVVAGQTTVDWELLVSAAHTRCGLVPQIAHGGVKL